MSNTTTQTMKAKIQSFKPTLPNLLLMENVLRQAIRNSYQSRHTGWLPTYKKWRRDDVKLALRAYRMMKSTEAPHVD
jgi:hypothetical protein